MHIPTILYASCACSEKKYSNLFSNSKIKPGQQVQKYHRLFAEGFRENGCNVIMITSLPFTRSNYPHRYFRNAEEIQNGVYYRYLSVINISVIKNIGIILRSFIEIRKRARKNKNVYIICDILNQSVALGALLAAKSVRTKCIGIVTDLPELLSENHKTIYGGISNYILKHCTDYILMTEQMNQRVNPNGKPYIVLEGHVDYKLLKAKEKADKEKYTNFVCMYTGEISRKCGIDILVDGFLTAGLPEAELHLYGNGEYERELQQICLKNYSVRYFGVRLNEEVLKEQGRASLLVNPRLSSEEFTKYSFPSKNMEYMVSGTPILTTKLPGMPQEYYPYVYFIEEESAGGIAGVLTKLYYTDRHKLESKGEEARKFALEYKNSKVQASKVIKKLMRH